MGFKIGHPFLKYAIERMFVGYKASRYGSLLQQFFRNVRGFCRDHCLVSESLLEKSSENFNCCDVKIIGKFSCSSFLRHSKNVVEFFYSSRQKLNQIFVKCSVLPTSLFKKRTTIDPSSFLKTYFIKKCTFHTNFLEK